jgi:hypothetical protein
MRVVRVGPLPDRAIEAAAAFHATTVPEILGVLVPPRSAQADLALVFPPASFEHRGWRLAAVQDLARAAAPARVNGIVGADQEAVAATLAWLDQAPGITGQLLSLQTG